ncbi:MAG: hypothetical protein AB7S86_07710 [Hydrogenophaga sp.]|uniref:hypothetical protein n=1 Tax=Hydrogenophaga sp. TaxID=1904254 RepID=UPI003D0D8087
MLVVTWATGLALLGICAVVAWRTLPVFFARFDGKVLRVAPPAPIASAASPPGPAQAAWQRLHAWCFDGAGDGRSPLWRPWAAPRMEQRFSTASLVLEPVEDRERLVQHFLHHLDGSDQLAAVGGTLARVLLRLRVKRDDCLWWRARRPTDPWDCGYLVGGDDGLHALLRFQPRRATLMVADGLEPATVRAAMRVLQDRSAMFRHPVRLLVVGNCSADAEVFIDGSAKPFSSALARSNTS